MTSKPLDFSAAVLTWYDANARRLPWRAPPGRKADPYAVWLSEIMLQQTTVAVVEAYFDKFMTVWPTVSALAEATLDEVLRAWAGLGYYARARNLKRCAEMVMVRHNGIFPADEKALRALPGIGSYTAAAIMAIAFNCRANVVDGNVERVMARLFAVTEPLPKAKSKVRELALSLLPAARFGDYAQGLMDLGATICTPRNPKCSYCPVISACSGAAQGIAAELPARSPRTAKPRRRGAVFWMQRDDGAVWLRRRPENGLLGGMMEVPTSPWTEETLEEEALRAQAPLDLDWICLPGTVRHTFTHFHLELQVYAAKTECVAALEGEWSPRGRLGEQALPSVMKKVVRHALAEFND